MSKTRAPKAAPIYRAENARRILAGHVSNHYGELIDVKECSRNLLALADHAYDGGDDELAAMATETAAQLRHGLRPAIIFPTLGIDDVVAPEHVEEVEREALERTPERVAADERALEARVAAQARREEHEDEHGAPNRGLRGEAIDDADRGKRDELQEDQDDPAGGQCRGKTKKGKRCKANALKGSRFCRAHDEQESA